MAHKIDEIDFEPVSINDDGEIIVDVEFVAPDLGLTPEEFMTEMEAGRVFQTAEKGIDDDEGRMRLTFRHRAKETRFVIDENGQIVADA
ncbi:MAG: hypothetical protein ACJAU6_000892 [Alphaproteobacteria bacterium]|jgi:hypothetical protein